MKKIIISSILSLTILFDILAPTNTEASASTKSVPTVENIILESTKYRYGGMSPSRFDCSGFVVYTYKKATGKTLPRSTKGLYESGTAVQKKIFQKETLLFSTLAEEALHT